MSDDPVVGRTDFSIVDIRPTPDDETLAAITAALVSAWPQPVATVSAASVVNSRWRFGLRRWGDRQIPRRTWGTR